MNKFSKEYIKKNFRVKKFCKHLDYILDKKKGDKNSTTSLYVYFILFVIGKGRKIF